MSSGIIDEKCSFFSSAFSLTQSRHLMKAFASLFCLIFFVLFSSCDNSPPPENLPTPTPEPDQTEPPETDKCLNFPLRWETTVNEDILQINYGFHIYFPQFAALHLNSGYLRMLYKEEGGWGTSISLIPSFWENGELHLGTDIEILSTKVEECELIIEFSGQIRSLMVEGTLRFLPLDLEQEEFEAEVSIQTTGHLQLDSKPGEAYKLAFLSSMNLGIDDTWDAQNAFVDNITYPFPQQEGRIIDPPVGAKQFGVQGGTSSWKADAPTIEILLEEPYLISGWKTASQDPNDDNIGVWAASDSVVDAFQYRIIAKGGN